MPPRSLVFAIGVVGNVLAGVVRHHRGRDQADDGASGGDERATDIVALARGACIALSEWVRDEALFEKLLDRRFDDGGPVLLAAKIDDTPGQGRTARDPALIRNRFLKGLGTSRSGALDA